MRQLKQFGVSSTDPWASRVIKKIDKCGKELTRSSKRCFGSVRKELEKRKQLKGAKQMAIRTGDSSRMKILEGEVNILLDKEAKMWRQ